MPPLIPSVAIMCIPRNMALVRDPVVAERLDTSGIAGTTIQLARDAMEAATQVNAVNSADTLVYVENVISALTNMW